MFREHYPAAWIFHKNSSQTPLNIYGGNQRSAVIEHGKEYPGSKSIVLPEVNIPTCDFGNLLLERYSCRNFSERFISLSSLSHVLFAGYGVKKLTMRHQEEVMERTIPSAGGMYSLELYVVNMRTEQLEPGVYHYLFYPGLLEQVKKMPIPENVIDTIFLDQDCLTNASVIIVATSIIEKTMKKYLDRGYRYILYEIGHCFQNMNLMAGANNLASVNIGSFFDKQLAEFLEIDIENEIPLYAMALGVDKNAG